MFFGVVVWFRFVVFDYFAVSLVVCCFRGWDLLGGVCVTGIDSFGLNGVGTYGCFICCFILLLVDLCSLL